MTPDQVREYCEASAHIARSPLFSDTDEHFGYSVRLQEKYYLSESGEFEQPNLDRIADLAERKYDIFLSYAHEDAPIASELRDTLERHKLTCFLAEKSLHAGDDWSEEIRRALIGSTFLLVLLTQRSKGKPWLQLEAGAAWALRKRIVPVLNQVEISELTEPFSRSQARKVETAEQRRRLAKELVGRRA